MYPVDHSLHQMIFSKNQTRKQGKTISKQNHSLLWIFGCGIFVFRRNTEDVCQVSYRNFCAEACGRVEAKRDNQKYKARQNQITCLARWPAIKKEVWWELQIEIPRQGHIDIVVIVAVEVFIIRRNDRVDLYDLWSRSMWRMVVVKTHFRACQVQDTDRLQPRLQHSRLLLDTHFRIMSPKFQVPAADTAHYLTFSTTRSCISYSSCISFQQKVTLSFSSAGA